MSKARTTSVEITVHAEPEAVFPYLVEPDRLHRWVGGLVETHPLTDGGPGLGARSRDVVVEGKRRMEFESEITGWDPPRRMVVKLDGPGLEAVSTYTLEPVGEGTTRVRHSQDVRYRGLLRLVAPFVAGVVERKLEGDLERLRGLVEEGV